MSESNRQRAARENGLRILAVAASVFARDPSASIGDVADEAQVARRTVYMHYPTREDLVLALVQEGIDRLASAVRRAEACGDPVRGWSDLIEELWAAAPQYRVLLALRNTSFSPAAHERYVVIVDRFERLIEAGQQAGAFSHLVRARVLAAAVEGVLLALIALPDGTVDVSSLRSATLLALGADVTQPATG